jgi:predicted Zn-dependent protease
MIASLNVQVIPAAAYAYLGTGSWGTNTLYLYYYTQLDYTTAAAGARDSFFNNTHLFLYTTVAGYENIGVVSSDYGDSGWTGAAYICGGGYCQNQNALNSTYSYAEARINRYSGVGYGQDSWPTAQKQSTIAHELGHTFSLAHVSCQCLMYPDIIRYTSWGINGVTQDEINGINARY